MTAIYTRDDAGLVTYRGETDRTPADLLDERFAGIPDEFRPEPEPAALMGWPHTAVEWHGNIGFAV